MLLLILTNYKAPETFARVRDRKRRSRNATHPSASTNASTSTSTSAFSPIVQPSSPGPNSLSTTPVSSYVLLSPIDKGSINVHEFVSTQDAEQGQTESSPGTSNLLDHTFDRGYDAQPRPSLLYDHAPVVFNNSVLASIHPLPRTDTQTGPVVSMYHNHSSYALGALLPSGPLSNNARDAQATSSPNSDVPSVMYDPGARGHVSADVSPNFHPPFTSAVRNPLYDCTSTTRSIGSGPSSYQPPPLTSNHLRSTHTRSDDSAAPSRSQSGPRFLLDPATSDSSLVTTMDTSAISQAYVTNITSTNRSMESPAPPFLQPNANFLIDRNSPPRSHTRSSMASMYNPSSPPLLFSQQPKPSRPLLAKGQFVGWQSEFSSQQYQQRQQRSSQALPSFPVDSSFAPHIYERPNVYHHRSSTSPPYMNNPNLPQPHQAFRQGQGGSVYPTHLLPSISRVPSVSNNSLTRSNRTVSVEDDPTPLTMGRMLSLSGTQGSQPPSAPQRQQTSNAHTSTGPEHLLSSEQKREGYR